MRFMIGAGLCFLGIVGIFTPTIPGIPLLIAGAIVLSTNLRRERTNQQRPANLERRESSMKIVARMTGLFLILCGLGAAVYFYGFFETSVEVPTTEIFGQTIGGGRVANLSLMQERQNGIIFGFGAFVVGAVLMYLGRERNEELATGERACPFCAERIKEEAKVCRYCQKDLPDRAIAYDPTRMIPR